MPRSRRLNAVADEHRDTRTVIVAAVSLALAAPVGFLTGCESAPGDEPEQGAAIGGVAGALAGAAVAGDDDRLVGAVIGGILGAGGGYLIGTQLDKKNQEEAREAAEKARQNPASPEQARDATTADVNGDGFVTLDEVIAMEQAGLSDPQMVDRLRATNQVFELSADQRDQLRTAGVSDDVIREMPRLNREQLTRGEEDRISQPR